MIGRDHLARTGFTGARAGRPSEMGSFWRAAFSSVLATLVDGATYQLAIAVTQEHNLNAPRPGYAAAAAGGAVLGAIANFSLNRWWVFGPQEKPLLLQGARYAVGSLLTLLVLQMALWLLIERLGLGASVAWIPAKALTWIVFSYPFQRFFVFAGAGH